MMAGRLSLSGYGVSALAGSASLIRQCLGKPHFFKPKGFATQSPGGRAASYPGKNVNLNRQPQRGCGTAVKRKQLRAATPPLGLRMPRAISQGSSLLATLGFETESLW